MDWQAFRDEGAFAAAAADIVSEVVAAKPDAVIALPTGRTPTSLYAELVRRARSGTLDLGTTRFFNLDEYLGVPAADARSFAAYLRREFLVPAGIADGRVRLIRGDAMDPAAECRAVDVALEDAGGIELAILGLGSNGHIAFNEPGADWSAETHVADLSIETRAANAAGVAEVLPASGITLGIGTLSAARRVLLLVDGASKRRVLEALREGRPTRDWPVTALLGHPRTTVVVGPALA